MMTDEELLRLINLSQQEGRSDKVLASNFSIVASELYSARRKLAAHKEQLVKVRAIVDGCYSDPDTQLREITEVLGC